MLMDYLFEFRKDVSYFIVLSTSVAYIQIIFFQYATFKFA